jgi:autotransporter-associated beta strand protein/T5SS/PEP-CTERM-associated repeat protein
MKKRSLNGTREANTLMALVCATTVHLISPQAHAENITIDSGTTTINSDTTYGTITIAGFAGLSATLEVTSGTVTTDTAYVGFEGNGTLNLTGGNLTTGQFIVGLYGTGTLNLTGGDLTTGQSFIGYNTSSTATVSGGSTWTVGGSLVVGFNDAIGTLTIDAGGTVIANGGVSRNPDCTINLNEGGTLQINSSSSPFGGSFLSGDGDLTNDGTLIFNLGSGDNTSHSGVFSGSGSLIKQGSGTLTLTGANTYSGTTTVDAGTLQLSNSLALQNSALDTSGAGVVTLSSVSAPTLGGLIGSTNLADVITTDYGNVTALTLNPQSGASNSYSGVIANGADGMTFTKSGAGTQVLSGANTYTGTTTISAGNLTLQSTNASSAYVIAGGATLEINNAGNLNFATTTYSGTGTFKKTGAGEVVWSDSTATFALGSGSLIDVQEGTMVAGNFANEVWTSNLSDLTVASGATFDGVEANIRVDALNGGGTIKSGYGDQVFTFGVDNGGGTFSGVLTDSHAPGNYTKVGLGTQILTGANTYTGTTTISAGTLEVSGTAGALTATTAVNINGGTLLLSGSEANRINDDATISLGAGSTLQLSGAVTETLGALTLAGEAGVWVIDFGATSGLLTFDSLTGSSSQGLEIWNWTDGTDQFIITNGFGGSLTTSNISFYSGQGSAPGSSFLGTAQFSSGSTGELVPVPEASTLLGVLGLMAPLAWRERRHWMRCREARG